MSAVTVTVITDCGLQALVKVALSRRMHHPNIVPVLGVAEHPTTKDMLLVRTDTLFFIQHNSCKTIIALTAKAGGCFSVPTPRISVTFNVCCGSLYFVVTTPRPLQQIPLCNVFGRSGTSISIKVQSSGPLTYNAHGIQLLGGLCCV